MFKRLSELPWSDIEALDRKHLAYVLPIGSTEQHGRSYFADLPRRPGKAS